MEMNFMIDYPTDRDKIIRSMTDLEFKSEAKRRGYNIIKRKPREKVIPLLPCTCGRKRIVSYGLAGSCEYYKCACGLTGPTARSDAQARINWNKMIESRCD
jgi:hypothetical protein